MPQLMSLEPVTFVCAQCAKVERGEQLGLWYRLPEAWFALLSDGDVIWTCSVACARAWVLRPPGCAECHGQRSHADTCNRIRVYA